MKTLNNEELKNINGGISFGLLALLGGAITFIIVILDGLTRPLKCRYKWGKYFWYTNKIYSKRNKFDF